MRFKKTLLMVALVLVASGLAAPVCFGQLQKPPELLLRLWPFFRSTRPVPLLPEPEVQPTEEGEKKRPLIAPFIPRKVDINNATLSDLQNLPGVGPSMGAHIMAGRPYSNFDDLLRDGVPQNVVQGLKDKITFGR